MLDGWNVSRTRGPCRAKGVVRRAQVVALKAGEAVAVSVLVHAAVLVEARVADQLAAASREVRLRPVAARRNHRLDRSRRRSRRLLSPRMAPEHVAIIGRIDPLCAPVMEAAAAAFSA